MFNNITKSLLGFGLSVAVFGTAQAYPVGAQLDIIGDSPFDTNVPGFTLSNLSSSTLDIIGFNLTIGNTAFNFDDAGSNYPTSLNYSVIHNNTGSGGRADNISLSFVGFNPGELYGFYADVDVDSSNTTRNFQTVLFNNGTTPNSVFSVTFSNGGVLSMTLPENPLPIGTADNVNNTYRFTLTGNVPVPGTLLLLAAGMIGFRTRLLTTSA